MGTFLHLQKRAQKLTPQKVSRDLFRFIRTLEKQLAEYNREQLNKGSKDIFGKDIGFYSKGTELITKGRKKEGQPFDLLETGKFLKALFAKVQGVTILFDTTDPKKNEVLANLLSMDIFGLTDEDLTKAIDKDILPFLQNYYDKALLR